MRCIISMEDESRKGTLLRGIENASLKFSIKASIV
jgi:hypothetical protein